MNGEQKNNNQEADGERNMLASRPKHIMEVLLRTVAPTSIPKAGDLIEGVVLEKKGPRLFVDLGPYGTGIVFGREYTAANDIIKGLNPGDPVSGKVVEADNDEGYVELSLKEAGEERRWVDLKKMMQAGEILELPVLEANRGGLILEIKSVKGFLPASHLSSKNYPRVEGGDKEKIYGELQRLVGQPLKVKILDIDPKENKLIFTERGQTSEELQSAFSKYKIGDVVEGEITSVVDFGAFVKFDEAGLEGLIHISEIDWILIEDPRTILSQGQRVQAKIIDIRGDKISLSLKQLKEDPWSHVLDKFHKGDTVQGKITKFNPFGVFAQLDKDIHGLIHISEFGTEAKMRELVKVGNEYPLKVLMIDPKEHRMSLGLFKEKDLEDTQLKEEVAEKKEEVLEKKEEVREAN